MRIPFGQSLAESSPLTEDAPAPQLTGQGGSWVMEFLQCMERAESAGIPRDEARMLCGPSLAESAPLTLE